MRLWMLRTPDFKLRGPMSEAELQRLLEARQIAARTELCPSDGDWFLLEEQEFLRKYFDVSKIYAPAEVDADEKTLETPRQSPSTPKAVFPAVFPAAPESVLQPMPVIPTSTATKIHAPQPTAETKTPRTGLWVLLGAAALIAWILMKQRL